jgi:hypothetical protein
VTRTLIIGVLSVAAAGLSWRAFTHNRERRQLEVVERRLDAELDRKRPVAANLEHWREQLASLDARLAEARRRTTPDLKALAERLAAIGVDVHQESASSSAHPFTLTSSKSATMLPAFGELTKAGHEIDATRIEARGEGWTGDFIAHAHAWKAPVDSTTSVGPEPWYGILNTAIKNRIAEKEEELAALDAKLGNLAEYWTMEEELKSREKRLEELVRDRIRLVPLAVVLFAKEPHVFASGSLQRVQGELRGGLIGRLARPMEDRALTALFEPELTARVVRRHADTIQIAFQRK